MATNEELPPVEPRERIRSSTDAWRMLAFLEEHFQKTTILTRTDYRDAISRINRQATSPGRSPGDVNQG